MLNISARTKDLLASDEMAKYPCLREYLNTFIKNDGAPEDPEYLPDIIVWIRKNTDNYPSDWFKMDDDTYDEFCSWGHNSRWKNVFWSYLVENIDDCVKICLKLAQDKGDVDVKNINWDDE